MQNIFNVTFCSFSKVHSTQDALLKSLQSWQNELYDKDMLATVSIDLSKTYEFFPNDLLLAKLNIHGIDSMGFLL